MKNSGPHHTPAILLIEDNPGDARLICELLSENTLCDFNVVVVDRVTDGCDHITKNPVDLVLLDLSLPDSHGIETLNRVRAVAPAMPVVVLTGLDDEVIGLKAISQGAQDYLVKGTVDHRTLARAITYAIERKQFQEALYLQNRTLLSLQHTALDLVSQLDLEQLLENIVRRASDLVGTTAAFLHLVDPNTKQLVPQIAIGALEDSLKIDITPGQGVAGQVWQTRQPLVVEDYPNWAGSAIQSERNLIRSIIGVPLLSGTDMLGVLGLAYEITSDDEFKPETLELLNQFARLATIAIENARLFTAAEHELHERSRVEQALRKSEENFRNVIEHASDGIFIADNEGRYVDVNSAGCALLGYSCDEITQKTLSDFTLTTSETQLPWDALRQGQVILSEQEMIRKDGSAIPVEISTKQLPDGRFQSIVRDITNRKEAEASLRLQATALEAAANAIVITDRDGVIEWINPSFTTMTGYRDDESTGRNPRELLRSGHHDRSFFQSLWETILAGQTWQGEIVNRRKNGNLYTEEQTITPVFDDGGRITHFIAIKQDVTTRRQAEQALQESERTLSTLMSNLPGMAYRCLSDTHWTMLFVSQGSIELLGYEPDALIQNRTVAYADVIHPDDRENVRRSVESAVNAGHPFRMIYRVVSRENKTKWVWEQGQGVTLADGTRALEGFITDITTRVETQEALQKREEQYRLITDNMRDVVWLMDMDLNTYWVSPSIERTLGYTPDEIMAHPVDQHITPDSIQRFREEFSRDVAPYLDQPGHTLSITLEMAFYQKAGSIAWSEVTFTVLRDAEGSPYAILGSGHDITKRKHAEDALAAEHQLLRTLIDTLPHQIYAKDATGKFILKNEADVRKMGAASPSEVIGKTDFDYYPHELAERYYADDMAVIQSGQPLIDREEPSVDVEGNQEWVLTTKVPLRDSEGAVTGLVGIGRDITERKQTENALQNSLKKLEILFDILPIGVSVLGPDRQVVANNSALRNMLDITHEEFQQGRHMTKTYLRADGSIMPPDEAPSARVFNGEDAARNVEVGVDKKDGTRGWVDITAIACPLDDWKVVVVANDITHRKQAEQALSQYAQRLSILHTVDLAILSAQSPEEIANAVASHIQQTLDVYRLIVVAFDPHTDEARIVATRLGDTTYREAGAVLSPEEILGLDRLREQEVVLIDDLSAHADEPTIRALLAEGVCAIANIPLIAQGKLVGMIGLGFDQPGPANHKDLDIVSEVGAQLALAISQANLYNAEREQRVFAEELSRTATAINRTLKLHEVLASVLDNIKRVIPYDAGNIRLIEANEARVVYSTGYADRSPERTSPEPSIPVTETPSLSHMVEHATPLVVSHVDHYLGWVTFDSSDWIGSYLGTPISHNGQVIGVISLDSATPSTFTVNHAERLQAFADHAAIAIQNARLYQELEHHNEYLEQAVAARTRELQASEKRYRAIVEDQTELICRCLPDGTVVFVNVAFCQFYGRSQEDLLAYTFDSLVNADTQMELNQQLAALSLATPTATFEGQLSSKTGDIHWIQWTIRALFDDKADLTEIQAVGRDITKRHHAEERVQQALVREMELSELKSRYVSMAAHDLRNPLAIIKSAISLIHEYGDRLTEEKKQTKFDHIDANITVMVEMLDDILTIGKVESGKLSFNPTTINVVEFCKKLTMEAQQAAGTEQRIELSNHWQCNTARLDGKLLRHILGNLLSNALKYSPADKVVHFDIACDADWITFRIQDQGIGIPESEKARLFEAFHRAPNARHLPGTGLGMAIVKQSVNLHQGSIAYESEEGIGTTFTVTIPYTPRSKGK